MNHMNRTESRASMPYPGLNSPQVDIQPSIIPPILPQFGIKNRQNGIGYWHEEAFQNTPQLLHVGGERAGSSHLLSQCFPGAFAFSRYTSYNQVPHVAPSFPFTHQIPRCSSGWPTLMPQFQSPSFNNSPFNTSLRVIPHCPAHPLLFPLRNLYPASSEKPVPQSAAPLPNRNSEEKKPISQEPSLGNFSDADHKTVKLSGKAAKRRNVFKCCVRHMYSFINKNKEEIVTELKAEGYSIERIGHAFEKVAQYSDIEKHKGQGVSAQKIMKKIVEERSIYTFILMKTLEWMLGNWEKGDFGKMFSSNISVYREVCRKYLEAAQKVFYPSDTIRRVRQV